MARGLVAASSWAKAAVAKDTQASTRAVVKVSVAKRLFISDYSPVLSYGKEILNGIKRHVPQ
jgi:hypothetical protein